MDKRVDLFRDVLRCSIPFNEYSNNRCPESNYLLRKVKLISVAMVEIEVT